MALHCIALLACRVQGAGCMRMRVLRLHCMRMLRLHVDVGSWGWVERARRGYGNFTFMGDGDGELGDGERRGVGR